jgi:hypothetical protein
MMTAGIGALAAVNTGNQGFGVGMSTLGGLGVGGYLQCMPSTNFYQNHHPGGGYFDHVSL